MSNVFKETQFMPNANINELKAVALENATQLLGALQDIPNMTAYVMISILATGVRIAVNGKSEINQKEKDLIQHVFGDICNADIADIIDLIDQPLDERSYKIVKDLAQMSPQLAGWFCNFILCFAYVDGVFEDEPSQKLSDIMTGSMNVFPGTPEDFLDNDDET